MAKGTLLWNLMARRYSRAPLRYPEEYERKLEITRKYLNPESEVFEIGCGTGTTALRHAPYVKRIHGRDFSRKMIEIANERRAAGNVENATFTVGMLDDPDLKPNSYDVVLGLNILHLLEDKPAALARLRSVLKPGGYFISSTPCIVKIPIFWRVLLSLFRLFGFPKLESLTVEQLQGMIEAAGFKTEEQWVPKVADSSLFLVTYRTD